MSVWGWILLTSAGGFLTKLVGYLIPERWLEHPRVLRVAGVLTVGLLASLTAVNTFADGRALAVDARMGALVAAAIALGLRVPFLGVVLVGAAAAGGLRLAGFS